MPENTIKRVKLKIFEHTLIYIHIHFLLPSQQVVHIAGQNSMEKLGHVGNILETYWRLTIGEINWRSKILEKITKI